MTTLVLPAVIESMEPFTRPGTTMVRTRESDTMTELPDRVVNAACRQS
jgi:hypothetical protein